MHCYLYGNRVAAEEKALVDTPGKAYAEYMLRTKRFMPFVIWSIARGDRDARPIERPSGDRLRQRPPAANVERYVISPFD